MKELQRTRSMIISLIAFLGIDIRFFKFLEDDKYVLIRMISVPNKKDYKKVSVIGFTQSETDSQNWIIESSKLSSYLRKKQEEKKDKIICILNRNNIHDFKIEYDSPYFELSFLNNEELRKAIKTIENSSIHENIMRINAWYL